MKILFILSVSLLWPGLTFAQHREVFKDRVWYCVKEETTLGPHNLSNQNDNFLFILDFHNNGSQGGNHFSIRKYNRAKNFGEWHFKDEKLTLSLNLDFIDKRGTYQVITFSKDNFLTLKDSAGQTYYLVSGD